MPDNPEDLTNNGDFWQYEVDTAQREGTTGQTLERRHGKVDRPEPDNENRPNDEHAEDNGMYDAHGIPKNI
jgi:hypothetical protein